MVTVYETMIRYRKVGTRPTVQLNSPESVYQFMKKRAIRALPLEKFWVIGLDARGNDILVKVIPGWLDQVPVNLREVFQHLILSQSISFVICHNHPSGNLVPSKEDRTFTRMLSQVAEALKIPLLDHIIISKDHYYSFAESGLLSS